MSGLGRKPKPLSSNDNPLSEASDMKAKGPAEAATSPSHGSTNPEKDTEMNEVTNTTAEHPWEAARRHANDLSEALTGCNAPNWYAHVFPSDRYYSVCFAAKPCPEDADEMPIDRVNRRYIRGAQSRSEIGEIRRCGKEPKTISAELQ